MKPSFFQIIFLVVALGMTACVGEDRSGEQPRAPEGITVEAEVHDSTCQLNGHVGLSHNSSLTQCGFYWGNDTLHNTFIVDTVTYHFQTSLDSLATGEYYAVAYAANGIGLTTSDTVYFTIE